MANIEEGIPYQALYFLPSLTNSFFFYATRAPRTWMAFVGISSELKYLVLEGGGRLEVHMTQEPQNLKKLLLSPFPKVTKAMIIAEERRHPVCRQLQKLSFVSSSMLVWPFGYLHSFK